MSITKLRGSSQIQQGSITDAEISSSAEISFNKIQEVQIVNAEEGDLLIRDSNGNWTNINSEQLINTLSSIGGYQVVINNLQNRDLLTFNTQNSIWENLTAEEFVDGGNF